MVLEGGLSPEYVLDKMQYYEIKPLLNQLHAKNKDIYEAARMIAYVYSQSNTKKKLKPTDIFKFPWDKSDGETSISNDDIMRLTAKAKQQEKTLNNAEFSNTSHP